MSEDKKLNEVIRVKKRPSNFVMMDKTFLEDDRLSYKAKGLLAYLLSKPDDWKVIVGNLVNSSKDGKASVYAGLKELGYMNVTSAEIDKSSGMEFYINVSEVSDAWIEVIQRAVYIDKFNNKEAKQHIHAPDE